MASLSVLLISAFRGSFHKSIPSRNKKKLINSALCYLLYINIMLLLSQKSVCQSIIFCEWEGGLEYSFKFDLIKMFGLVVVFCLQGSIIWARY